MTLLVVAMALLLGSAVLALAAYNRPRVCMAIGTGGTVAAAATGLWPAWQALCGDQLADVALPWRVPGGSLVLGLDALSAYFLVPLLVLSALAALYGRSYMLAYAQRKWLGPPAFAFNMLVLSMMLVVLARGAVLLLVAWEAMTLASYLLVVFEHEEPTVRRAGLVYLVAAHVGVACLIGLFLLLDAHAGGLDFAAFATMPAASAGQAALVFGLALIGFGVKAGFVPLHVWLPEAHAAAPSHVSALMSGVLIKLGLYGLLRVFTFLSPAVYWGPLLITLGMLGALCGIVLGLYQRDMKRVLAYSSVENVGIITIGLGVAYWAAGRNLPGVAALAACGALLHVWNHTLMKGLMFLSAGSIVHSCSTRDIEHTGGLLRRMPSTGSAMLIGAVAIAGLPPLNGFVSEWLIYLGLIGGGLQRGHAAGSVALLSVGLFALAGGLASLCFVRLAGVVLLGEPRSDAARHAHESPASLTSPLWVLALGCLAIALFPDALVLLQGGVILHVFGAPVAAELGQVGASLSMLGRINALLVALLAAFGALLALVTRPSRQQPSVDTWGCGYAAPTAKMQYTGRSFSEFFSERLLPRFLRARISPQARLTTFPSSGAFESQCVDPLTRNVYEPFFAVWADRFSRLRFLQQGVLQVYLLYILFVVVVGLGWVTWLAWMRG